MIVMLQVYSCGEDEFGGEYNSQNFGSLSIDEWQHVAIVCENNSATFIY